MATLHSFKKSLATFADFEDDELVSESHEELETVSSSTAVVSTTSRRLFMTALIDHLCSLYEKNPHRKEKLYQVICKALVKARMLSPAWTAAEFSSMRRQFQTGFVGLIQAAMESVSQDIITTNAGVQSTSIQRLMSSHSIQRNIDVDVFDLLSHMTSKFKSEFTDVFWISEGAYGKVYRATKKVDGVQYAIKEIDLDDGEPASMLKTCNEFKLLANLSDANVVRYYDSWLEQKLVRLSPKRNDECDDESSHESFVQQAEPHHLLVTDVHHRGLQKPRLVGRPAVAVCDDDWIVFDDTSASSRHVENGLAVMARVPVAHAGLNVNGHGLHTKTVLYIQMELCKMTLKDWLEKRNSSSSSTNVIRDEDNKILLKQILKGIEYIHSKQLIHRDLKPQNIFISSDNVRNSDMVKIGDFGLARKLPASYDGGDCGDTSCSFQPADDNIDGLSKGVGNDLYSAPEQLNGSYYSTKADMYSVGIMLFEMYQHFTTEMERRRSLKNLRDTQDVWSLAKYWPLEAEIVQKLISKDPKCRPSASELLHSDLFTTKYQIIMDLRSQLALKDERITQLQCQLAEKDERIAQLERQLQCRM